MYHRLARHLRKNMTDAEQHLWHRLRRRQLDGHRFRRQAPIGRYIVDFVCFERKIVVELDGGQHSEAVAVQKDEQRTRWLRSQGFSVLRFWNHDVLQETDAVLESILVVLSPLPGPPPQGGREIGSESP